MRVAVLIRVRIEIDNVEAAVSRGERAIYRLGDWVAFRMRTSTVPGAESGINSYANPGFGTTSIRTRASSAKAGAVAKALALKLRNAKRRTVVCSTMSLAVDKCVRTINKAIL